MKRLTRSGNLIGALTLALTLSLVSNGSTVSNTGAFIDQRPPGLAISRTALSAVYLDGLCCINCCSGSLCSQYCNFCGGATPTCPAGTTKSR